MKLLIFISIFISASLSFSQQGGVFKYLSILPTSLPTTCTPGTTRFDSSGHQLNLCYPANTWTAVGSGAGGTWGSITGTLSSQTDLQSALNGKQSTLSFIDSLVNTAGSVALSGDTASPGNLKYYGTNSSGTLGYNSLTSYANSTVAFLATGNVGTVTNPSVLIAPTVIFDTNSGYNASNGRFTIPISGYYLVGFSGQSGGATEPLQYYVNGSPCNTSDCYFYDNSGSAGLIFPVILPNHFNAGDYITWVPDGTWTGNNLTSLWVYSAFGYSTGNAASWSGYNANTETWSTSSTSLALPTNSGGNALTQIGPSSGLVVTPASGNNLGITWTPSTVSACYMVDASTTMDAATNGVATSALSPDGTTLLDSREGANSGTIDYPTHLSGLYCPGTTSPVTIYMYLATSTGTMGIGSPSGLIPTVIWRLVQLSGYGNGIATVSSFGSTPNSGGATISGTAIQMQPADGTHGGGVSIIAQIWAGAKTFLASPIFDDASDNTKQITFNISGNTTGRTLTLAGTSSTSQTLNFPNITATDTLASLGLAQTYSSVQTFTSAPIFSSVSASQALTVNGSKALTSNAFGTAPAGSTISEWDANSNLSANSFIPGFTTTATAAGTTTMTIASAEIQAWTGSSAQTIKLPTTSVAAGAQYYFINLSTASLTIQSSGANTINTALTNTTDLCTAVVATPTTAANWSCALTAIGPIPIGLGGTGATSIATGIVTSNGTVLSSVTTPLALASGGTAKASVTVAAAATSWAGWDANKNLQANNHVDALASIATAAGTTALVVGSAHYENFTGATTQTVTLPVATGLSNGYTFRITNNSSGVVTIQSSGANVIKAMAAGSMLDVWCVNTAGGTGTASWNWQYTASLNN